LRGRFLLSRGAAGGCGGGFSPVAGLSAVAGELWVTVKRLPAGVVGLGYTALSGRLYKR
jgi:hypothetical protein